MANNSVIIAILLVFFTSLPSRYILDLKAKQTNENKSQKEGFLLAGGENSLASGIIFFSTSNFSKRFPEITKCRFKGENDLKIYE